MKYVCKRCGAEFPKTEEGLKEYRVHCIKCKKAHESEENAEAKETPVLEEKKPEIEEYKLNEIRKNYKCRGNYQGNRDKICKNYLTCVDCWADFNR